MNTDQATNTTPKAVCSTAMLGPLVARLREWASEPACYEVPPQSLLLEAADELERCERSPLTDEQLWRNDEIMSLNADLGWHMETIRMFVAAVERAHGIRRA
jgi:hypothetical protein